MLHMELYGYRVDEQSPAMQKKAYYCKIHSDLEVLAPKLKYKTIYSKKNSVVQVLSDAAEDRKKILEPAIAYINERLIEQKVYSYTADDILELCDRISGQFANAYLELCEDFCQITGQEQEMQELRELRLQARTRVGALGSSIPDLAVNILQAGIINATTGIIHSVVNMFGNALSSLERMDRLQSMYDSDYTWSLLQDGMRADCKCLDRVLAILLSQVLGNNWRYPFLLDRKKEIAAILQKIKDGMIPNVELPQVLVTCIINGAPYWPELYEFAETVLGDDLGNLLQTARFFSVYSYIEKCDNKAQLAFQERKRQALKANFFGEKQDEAEEFLEASDIWDTLYREIEGRITPDFNYMLSILNGERHFFIQGEEHGPILLSNTRRHLILFEFDFSLIQKEKEIAKYCKLCHVQLKAGERPYYFLNTTSFCTRKSGIVATNYGFYLSRPQKDNPLLYKSITAMRGGMLQSMDIFYKGKNAKVNLPAVEQINNFLVLTCMYFKYGKFI